MMYPAIYHNHCSVIEVSNALAVFLAFFYNEYLQFLVGQYHGFKGICQVVDIEDCNAVEFCDLIQVYIVCKNLCIVLFCKFHKFHVDLFCGREVLLGEDHIYRRFFLEPIMNPAAPPTTILNGVLFTLSSNFNAASAIRKPLTNPVYASHPLPVISRSIKYPLTEANAISNNFITTSTLHYPF